jgi:hypothetical protein
VLKVEVMRLSRGLCVVLLLAGCEGGEPAGAPGGPGGPGGPAGGDAGVCARPDEGCPCDPGATPVECYGEPTREGGTTMCHRGVRYCRDGAWTACETIETYELERTWAALVTGPSECNPCNPDCAIARDYPDDGDLNAGNSIDVVYDPAAGGITLEEDPPVLMTGPDSDGDGVPDSADECPGTGWRAPCDGDASDDGFYHTLPYGGAAEIDPLSFAVQVRTADVYFLMDTTFSMDGEIANLRTDLTSGTFLTGCSGGIIGAIRCTIPDAWFGVGGYDDYPVDPYGSASAGDRPYYHLQDIASSAAAAQTAVNSLTVHDGVDLPESQSQALYAVATGAGLLTYSPSRATAFGACAGTSWGYPCFRDGTIPIVIHFTDAAIHNGPNVAYDYTTFGTSSLPAPTGVSGNDTFATAYAIGDLTSRWVGFSGSTSSLSNNYDYGCGSGARDATFSFTLTAPTRITATLEGSGYDTVLLILDSLSPVSGWCNDDYLGYYLWSRMDLTLPAGTYYVVVDGYGTSRGNYRLSIGAAPPAAISWSQALTALNDRGVRVITVNSGGAGTDAESDAIALANGTGSVDSAGSPYVFNIATNGSGLSRAVVDAVVDLANYSRMDVTAVPIDNTATALDERGFVDSIRAVSWGPGSCAGISGGDTFVQCLPGTNVDFEVTFRNDFVMPTMTEQVFDFWIDVLGDGVYVLQRVPVRIVVPPLVPTYPPSGSYWRDYDSTTRCEIPPQRPDWGSLSWTATTPPDSRIRFEIRTADTLSGLPSATPATFDVPGTASPVDVGGLLVASGLTNFRPYLRVTAVLLASTDRTVAPVLSGFELQFTCVSSE